MREYTVPLYGLLNVWVSPLSLKGAETVQGLLEVAKDSIPRSHWKRTPVVLKATAGLRLLPEQKAQALLFEVIFEICILDNSFSYVNIFYGFKAL